MATGEKNFFDTRGQQVVKYESIPLPPGEYDLKLRGTEAAIGKKNEPGKFPYISVNFEALNTGVDGGKNRRVYHMFFLALKPGRDGTAMPLRGNQLVGYIRALGEDHRFPTTNQPDENGQPQPLLNPQQVLAWLQEHDGAVVKARTKIQRQAGYNDKTIIDTFIEVELAEENNGPWESSEPAAEEENEETQQLTEETEEVEERPLHPPTPRSTRNGAERAALAPKLVQKKGPPQTRR